MLQITAYLPQKGEVPLLASPPLQEAARLRNGTGTDANGEESLATGGGIETSWAGQIFGTTSADGENLTALWRGHRLTLPINGYEAAG